MSEVNTMSKKEINAMSEVIEQQVKDSTIKCQWLMVIAFNEVLGIGKDRLLKVFGRYEELLKEYNGYKRDGVSDEAMQRRIEQIFKGSVKRVF